jgi:hypothetical protein
MSIINSIEWQEYVIDSNEWVDGATDIVYPTYKKAYWPKKSLSKTYVIEGLDGQFRVTHNACGPALEILATLPTLEAAKLTYLMLYPQ